jgi:methyltransferase
VRLLAPATLAGLLLFYATLLVQRLSELALSARHVRALRARGAVEHGRAHFPLLVTLHVLWPPALACEVILGGARPHSWWPLALAAWLLAQALRLASMAALGDLWTVGIWVPPGQAFVRRGIYRWLRHPTYLAVAIELAAGPLIFGAWRTALGAVLVHGALMTIRIPAEEQALRG